MSIAEQVEMQKLVERVAELERAVRALEGFNAQVLRPAAREPLHLKDKKRG